MSAVSFSLDVFVGLLPSYRATGARARCVSFAASDSLASGAVAGLLPALVSCRDFGARPWLRPSPLERVGLPLGESFEGSSSWGGWERVRVWSGAEAARVLSFAAAGDAQGSAVSEALRLWEVDADDLELRFTVAQDIDAQCPLTDWSVGFNVVALSGSGYRRDGAPGEWTTTDDKGSDFDAEDVRDLFDGAGEGWSGRDYSGAAVVRWLSSQGVRGIVGASICSHSGEWVGGIATYGGSTDSAVEVAGRDFIGYVTPDQIRDEFGLVCPGGVEFDAARGWYAVVSGESVEAEVSRWATERVEGFFSGPLDDYVRGNVFVLAAEVSVDGLSGEWALGGVFGDEAADVAKSYGEGAALEYFADVVGDAWAWLEREGAQVTPPEYVI